MTILILLKFQMLQQYMNNSYMVTIFGYSAPSSDVEAVNLLKKAWGKRKIDN